MIRNFNQGGSDVASEEAVVALEVLWCAPEDLVAVAQEGKEAILMAQNPELAKEYLEGKTNELQKIETLKLEVQAAEDAADAAAALRQELATSLDAPTLLSAIKAAATSRTRAGGDALAADAAAGRAPADAASGDHPPLAAPQPYKGEYAFFPPKEPRPPKSKSSSIDMTFEEWKVAFGDIIEPGLLKRIFDQLDSDKNGKVSVREFINGIDGFHGGTWHPFAVKEVLQSDRLKMLDKISEIIRRKRQKDEMSKGIGWWWAPSFTAAKIHTWNDKEESRKYRRTVFTDEDWRRFRSDGTSIFHNLETMFNSRIIQGLWMEVGTVFLVALTVYVMNACILSGILHAGLVHLAAKASSITLPFLSSVGSWVAAMLLRIPTDTLFALPALPFQLSSPALGLLLVFRTNTAYARWNEARTAWSKIETHAVNLVRCGLAYLDPHEKEEHVRRVLAFAHCMLAHFRLEDGEMSRQRLQDMLTQLLGNKDGARLSKATVLPVQAMTDLSKVVRNSGSRKLESSIRARFGAHCLHTYSSLLLKCHWRLTHTHTRTQTHAHTRTHTHTYTQQVGEQYPYMCVCVCTHTHTHTICMCVCVCVCVYAERERERDVCMFVAQILKGALYGFITQ